MSLSSATSKPISLHVCITGSAQGIGLAAAKRLLANGHTVYHACRTQERAEEAVKAAGGGIPMECNLSDLKSVRSFAGSLLKIPRLDALCLNAGVAPSATMKTPRLTNDGFEEAIGVNHLGHFLLANLIYPKLKDSGGRLVVTASSVHDPENPAGKSGGAGATLGDLSGLGINLKENPDGPTMVDGVVPFDGNKCYKDSKLCNIVFCRHAFLHKFSGISVMSFNPGFMPTTGLFESMRKESWFKAQMLTYVARFAGFSVPIEVGGDRLEYMATSQDVKHGSYYSAKTGSHATTVEGGFGEVAISKEASNHALGLKLWEKSMIIVGLAK